MRRAYTVICDASDKDWLLHRKGLLTGSDAATIVGENRYKSYDKLVQEKAGLRDDTIPQNKYMWFGSEMERANMAAFSKLSGIRCRPMNVLLGSVQIPQYGATIDGMCVFPEKGIKIPYWNRQMYSGHFPTRRAGLGLVEMKNVGEKNLELWSGMEPPKAYWWQVQAQLDVTGLPWAVLVAKIGAADMRAYFIEKDDFSCEHLRSEIQTFWQDVEKVKSK